MQPFLYPCVHRVLNGTLGTLLPSFPAVLSAFLDVELEPSTHGAWVLY